MDTGKKTLCPSYQCAPGVQLIGVTRSDGKIHFVGKPITIDQEFVRNAHEGRSPEHRFRFSHPCAQGSCKNWTQDHHCGIAAMVAGKPINATGLMPNCGIRDSCRWYLEWGNTICPRCPEIVHG